MTTVAQITTLIDKLDVFEIVRDEIAAILVVEVAKQQELAVLASKSPDPWKLRVFTERSTPWSDFLGEDPEAIDPTPIVNVWFDNSSFPLQNGNVVERQKASGTFNIDCLALGMSEASDDGHLAGDELAARNAQRAVRLVRNILMSSSWAYLGLRGTVWRRWVQSITAYQPPPDSGVERCAGMRLALTVDFNELAPQFVGTPLALISATVKRRETGEIYFSSSYSPTPPAP